VTIRFEEPVKLDNARLLTSDGERVPSRTKVDGRTVTITPRATLPDGPVAASWAIVSDDGDPTPGAIAFVVGAREAVGPPQSLPAFPKIPTTLSGSRPGQLAMTMRTSGTSAEVTWTHTAIDGPLTWKLTKQATSLSGRGVLPLSGTWTYRATVQKTGGAVVVVSGTASLGEAS